MKGIERQEMVPRTASARLVKSVTLVVVVEQLDGVAVTLAAEARRDLVRCVSRLQELHGLGKGTLNTTIVAGFASP